MPQIQRNKAARAMFSAIVARYPDIDRAWLREQINEIVSEELRLMRADLIKQIPRTTHYHGGNTVPEDAVLTARKVLANLDRRAHGESV